jgi:hypothetical protein
VSWADRCSPDTTTFAEDAEGPERAEEEKAEASGSERVAPAAYGGLAGPIERSEYDPACVVCRFVFRSLDRSARAKRGRDPLSRWPAASAPSAILGVFGDCRRFRGQRASARAGLLKGLTAGR